MPWLRGGGRRMGETGPHLVAELGRRTTALGNSSFTAADLGIAMSRFLAKISSNSNSQEFT